jgi:ribulose 1,5-bisphosphate synthetase/thiazole synthase
MTDTREMTGTVKRDLHSARPLGADSARISPRKRSWPETLEADVVIVGSGISGALMAVALADGKRRIVIAGRREPGRL